MKTITQKTSNDIPTNSKIKFVLSGSKEMSKIDRIIEQSEIIGFNTVTVQLVF